MIDQAIFDEISNMRHARQGSLIALHKPLLLLLIYSRIYNHKDVINHFTFNSIKEELILLLKFFGWKNSSRYKPEYPFVFLGSSPKLWIPSILRSELKDPDNPSASEMEGAFGKLPNEFFEQLKNRKKNLEEIICYILEQFWPDTLHKDILNFLGIDITFISKNKRSSSFIQDVYDTYERKCAVCGHSLRLRDNLIGLDACHLRPLQYEGRDIITNGLALCKNHHWALDRGVISLDLDYNLKVANGVSGINLEDFLFKFEGKQIFIPRRKEERLNTEHIIWHNKNSFFKND